MVTNDLVTADEVVPVSSISMIVFPSSLPSTRVILASEVFLALNRTRPTFLAGSIFLNESLGFSALAARCLAAASFPVSRQSAVC
jgi:hypothetical protein